VRWGNYFGIAKTNHIHPDMINESYLSPKKNKRRRKKRNNFNKKTFFGGVCRAKTNKQTYNQSIKHFSFKG